MPYEIFHIIIRNFTIMGRYLECQLFFISVPKKNNSLRIENFRPIRLVSSLYKVSLNVLSKHIHEMLRWIISLFGRHLFEDKS